MIPHGKLQALEQVIEEGMQVEQLRRSQAWQILRRTLEAQKAVWLSEAFDAAKETSKNLPAFLGRIEALDWLLRCVEEDFEIARQRASEERESIFRQEREQNELDNAVAEAHNTAMLHKPGTL